VLERHVDELARTPSPCAAEWKRLADAELVEIGRSRWSTEALALVDREQDRAS
jgi:hypothetical protein